MIGTRTMRSSNLSIRIKPRAPYETAQIFCEHRAGKRNEALIRYRSTWYVWTGIFYRKLDTESVRAELWKFLAEALVREKRSVQAEGEDGQTQEEWVDRRFRPEPGDVNKLYDALMARPEIRVTDTVSAPGWLSTRSESHRPRDMLACSNTLVDLVTGENLPHTPYFLTMNAVDYAYNPTADCPRFEQFLGEIFPGSEAQRPKDYDAWDDEHKDAQQRRELVQEIFGYLLSGDTSQQKMFLFMGKPRSGKGTLARVLRRLIGTANVVLGAKVGVETPYRQTSGDCWGRPARWEDAQASFAAPILQR